MNHFIDSRGWYFAEGAGEDTGIRTDGPEFVSDRGYELYFIAHVKTLIKIRPNGMIRIVVGDKQQEL